MLSQMECLGEKRQRRGNNTIKERGIRKKMAVQATDMEKDNAGLGKVKATGEDEVSAVVVEEGSLKKNEQWRGGKTHRRGRGPCTQKDVKNRTCVPLHQKTRGGRGPRVQRMGRA